MASSSPGFTLVELLIVVVIMAILATASIAGYGRYVQRANRVDATATLLRISAAQERFYLQNDAYATTDDELRDPPPNGLGIDGSERGLYSVALTADPGGAAVGYVATASARSDRSQVNDSDCQEFSVDQSGRRGAANADGVRTAEIVDRCWR